MAKNLVSLSPPWVEYYQQLYSLFNEDPEIKMAFNENEKTISIFVDNSSKADAIAQLLPGEKSFGNVTIKVMVIPSNNGSSRTNLFERAFEGNPVLSFIHNGNNPITGDMTYVVFKNEVIQYFIDNLGDIHGNRSTLLQDIAKEVFGESDDLHFCTDEPGDFGRSTYI